MKNFRIILTLFALVISSYSFSQTTQEEYNYLTKGYKIQVESGLDMKKGYQMKSYGTWGTDYPGFSRNATFQGLYRIGESSPCAVLMIFQKTSSGYIEFFCIPHMNSNEEIWNQAFRNWRRVAEDWEAGAGYSWGIIKFISFQFSEE